MLEPDLLRTKIMAFWIHLKLKRLLTNLKRRIIFSAWHTDFLKKKNEKEITAIKQYSNHYC